MTRRANGGNRYIDLELSRPELIAFGHVATQWAFLEHLVKNHATKLAKRLNQKTPPDANNDSLRKRLRAWDGLAREVKKADHEYGERVLKIVRRVQSISGERHRLIHGRAIWNPSKRSTLDIVARGRAWKVNARRIGETAFKISRISYDLASVDGAPVILHDALPRKPARKAH